MSASRRIGPSRLSFSSQFHARQHRHRRRHGQREGAKPHPIGIALGHGAIPFPVAIPCAASWSLSLTLA